MLNVQSIDLYYGASKALSSVSFAAEQGKVACVLGRNGVGKTSLIRAISGLTPARGGSITLDGKDITSMTASERARHGMALVPPGRELFSQLTVAENLKSTNSFQS